MKIYYWFAYVENCMEKILEKIIWERIGANPNIYIIKIYHWFSNVENCMEKILERIIRERIGKLRKEQNVFRAGS